jgi:4-hydroxy-4-methyl-2-oxoglutarate aldolase
LPDIEQVRQQLTGLDTAAVCDADKALRVLDPLIRPVRPGARVVGLARPVACQGDFLPVIRALADAQPGEVLMVAAGAGTRAVAGELFTSEAARKGLAGIIVDGAVRDVASLRELSVPVYSRYITPMAGTTQDAAGPASEVHCAGVLVRLGEIVFADDDGVVVIAPDQFDVVCARAAEVKRAETRLLSELAAGASLISLTNFGAHWRRREAGRGSALTFEPED